MPRSATKGSCLSTWIIHETSYLTVIVEALYKSRPTMVILDSLSRPSAYAGNASLKELPSSVRNALSKHSRQCWKRCYHVYTRITEMEETLQSNQQYC